MDDPVLQGYPQRLKISKTTFCLTTVLLVDRNEGKLGFFGKILFFSEAKGFFFCVRTLLTRHFFHFISLT